MERVLKIKFLDIKNTTLVIFTLIFSLIALNLKAEKVTKIVATINSKDIISSYDIEQYKSIYTYIFPDQKFSTKEIIEKEIENILLNQEAVNFGINANNSSSLEQINQYIENLEKKGVSISSMKQDKKIDENFLLNYLQISMIKETLIQYLVSNNVTITDEELRREVSKISGLNGVPAFLLSEIFINSTSDSRQESFNKINQIYSKLNKDNFTELARKHSESISAKDGGNIGWVPATQLTSEQIEQIKSLKKGQITKPIRVQNGYSVFLVKDEKTEISYNPSDASVKRYIENSARQSLYIQKAELYIAEYIKSLKDKSTIEIR